MTIAIVLLTLALFAAALTIYSLIRNIKQRKKLYRDLKEKCEILRDENERLLALMNGRRNRTKEGDK